MNSFTQFLNKKIKFELFTLQLYAKWFRNIGIIPKRIEKQSGGFRMYGTHKFPLLCELYEKTHIFPMLRLMKPMIFPK